MALTEAQEKQKQKQIKYWKEREEEQKRHNLEEEEAYTKELERIYDNMLDSCQKEIDAFYGKYAKKEGITIAEAKKRVSELDIKAYERKAKKYVEEAAKDRKKNGATNYDGDYFSDQANEEMRLYNLTMKVNRLELLKANIGLELIKGHDELNEFMQDILQGRTEEELKRQAGILGKSVRDNAKTASAIVNASFHNAKFSDRIWLHQELLKNKLDGLLQSGLIQGKNPRTLARELEKEFGVKKQDAERLMRTELARVQTEAQKKSFEENGFTQYMFLALGDACPLCADIDGKHYDVEDMQPGLNAPPMHPHCRCSVAAYEDDEEFDAWLDYLDNGGTTEDWDKFAREEWRKGLRNNGKDSIIEPEDKGDLYTDLGSLSDNAEEASLQVNNFLNTLGLPESKWSGKTLIKKIGEMKAAGKKKRSCDIWIRENATIKNIIHEHLHARSISRTPDVYGKHHRIEEAVVELLAEEICKQNGIEFEATYKRRTNALKKVADLLEKESYFDFSKELMFVDVADRQAWIEEAIKEYKKKHKIKGLQKTKDIESAMKVLFEGGDE